MAFGGFVPGLPPWPFPRLTTSHIRNYSGLCKTGPMRQARVLEARSGMVRQAFWLLMVAGFGLPVSTLHAAPVIARDGETIELEGTIASFEGLGTLERPTVYVGLRLD